LNACRDGASTASLGNLFSVFHPLGENVALVLLSGLGAFYLGESRLGFLWVVLGK